MNNRVCDGVLVAAVIRAGPGAGRGGAV